jgi:hypothetical protein
MRRFSAAETSDPNALVGLACDESYWVRRQAVKNPATPGWVLDLLTRAGATPDLRGKGQFDPTLDGDSLRKLVEGGPWARLLVAEHPNTPVDVLDVLKDQPSISLRLAVAGHHRAVPNTLAVLCVDIEEAVRAKAVMHPQCPKDVIKVLTIAGASPDLRTADRPQQDLSPAQARALASLGQWGRFLVARNSGCPPELLADIAKNPDWRVRSGLLDNPNTPLDVLEHLLGSQDAPELASVHRVSSPDVPPEVLDKMARHPNAEVRMAVARHPAITPELLGWLVTDGTKEVRRFVANNPRTNPADINLLVKAGSTPDLMQLSDSNPEMEATELDTLSRRGLWARQLVVRHPNTSPNTLARLICDAAPKIREWAAVHPNVPQETIQTLIRAGSSTDYQGFAPPDPTLSPEDLRQLSQLGPWAEWVVAANPNTPPDLLERLAQSPDWQVRQLVAKNPNTSQAVLAQLAGDRVAEVSEATARRQVG